MTSAGEQRRLSTTRIESFSDAVLAIVMTLLVLDLLPTQVASPRSYLTGWPSYLAFLVAFLTVGSIWINHHAMFSRIRRADGAVFVLNLALLLGASLVPWPTAAVSLALSGEDGPAQVAALALYAVVTVLICLPWLLLDRHLARHADLLRSHDDAAWFSRHERGAAATMLVGLVAFAVGLWAPAASLGAYLLVVGFFVTARLRET